MQTANVNTPITVTGRHVSVTEAIRNYAHKKVETLHLDYPRIIEAKVILDVENSHRHIAEILLFCANHITIEASSVTEDMYASIDETISKVARRMRKYKTRMLKRTHRPRKSSIRALEEQIYKSELPEEEETEVEPFLIHKEHYRVRTLYPDEAIMELEMNESTFLVFQNAKSDRLNIIYRRKDGDYGIVEPSQSQENGQSADIS